MKESEVINTGRRNFITKIVPACSLLCAGGLSALPGFRPKDLATYFQEKHKFDKEFPKKLTYREYLTASTIPLVGFVRNLEGEVGKAKAMELLKAISDKSLLKRGQWQVQKAPDNSLQSYVAQFKQEDNKNWATFDIIEDNDKVFEMKITECLYATVYKDLKATDIGLIAVCQADYPWVEGFNPSIKLIRDKTLMEGHDCCNHRYVWE